MPDETNIAERTQAQTYFHCAPITLAPGSVVEPGNWGRVLHLYDAVNQQLQLNVIREALLELSRQAHFPHKPSRLEGVFAVPTLAEAIKFRNKHQRTSVIHEVIPVTENFTAHLGDYEIALTPFQARYLQTMFDFPRAYWTVTQPQSPEILFGCAVRVVAIPAAPPVPTP